MESLKNLETMVASWYKGMPHLPKNGQRWLAENAWWLVLIGVVLGSVSVFFILLVTLLAGTLLVGFGGALGAALGGLAFVLVVVSMGFAVVDMVISAIAISPLKAMRKKGWSLLFLAALINVLSVLVSFLFQLNLGALVWGLIFAGVGGYFLFEVRDYFAGEHRAKKARTVKPEKA